MTIIAIASAIVITIVPEAVGLIKVILQNIVL
jgi:hypothetical protein